MTDPMERSATKLTSDVGKKNTVEHQQNTSESNGLIARRKKFRKVGSNEKFKKWSPTDVTVGTSLKDLTATLTSCPTIFRSRHSRLLMFGLFCELSKSYHFIHYIQMYLFPDVLVLAKKQKWTLKFSSKFKCDTIHVLGDRLRATAVSSDMPRTFILNSGEEKPRIFQMTWDGNISLWGANINMETTWGNSFFDVEDIGTLETPFETPENCDDRSSTDTLFSMESSDTNQRVGMQRSNSVAAVNNFVLDYKSGPRPASSHLSELSSRYISSSAGDLSRTSSFDCVRDIALAQNDKYVKVTRVRSSPVSTHNLRSEKSLSPSHSPKTGRFVTKLGLGHSVPTRLKQHDAHKAPLSDFKSPSFFKKPEENASKPRRPIPRHDRCRSLQVSRSCDVNKGIDGRPLSPSKLRDGNSKSRMKQALMIARSISSGGTAHNQAKQSFSDFLLDQERGLSHVKAASLGSTKDFLDDFQSCTESLSSKTCTASLYDDAQKDTPRQQPIKQTRDNQGAVSPEKGSTSRRSAMSAAFKNNIGGVSASFINEMSVERVAQLMQSLDVDALDIMDLDGEVIAKQLTLMDAQLFCRIPISECIECCWVGKDREKKAPAIVESIELFNQVTSWVTSEVLKWDTASMRAMILSKFILIADKTYQLGNFSGLKAIISSLLSTPIFRLKDTWGRISSKLRRRHDDLCAIVSENDNYGHYREKLASVKPPCVPYLGIFLTDFMMVNVVIRKSKEKLEKSITELARARTSEKSPTESLSALILAEEKAHTSYDNCIAQLGSLVRSMQRHQNRTTYQILAKPAIQLYLLKYKGGSEEDNYNLSLKREPQRSAIYNVSDCCSCPNLLMTSSDGNNDATTPDDERLSISHDLASDSYFSDSSDQTIRSVGAFDSEKRDGARSRSRGLSTGQKLMSTSLNDTKSEASPRSLRSRTFASPLQAIKRSKKNLLDDFALKQRSTNSEPSVKQNKRLSHEKLKRHGISKYEPVYAIEEGVFDTILLDSRRNSLDKSLEEPRTIERNKKMKKCSSSDEIERTYFHNEETLPGNLHVQDSNFSS